MTEEEAKWKEAARVLSSDELHDRFAKFVKPRAKKEGSVVPPELPPQPSAAKQRGGRNAARGKGKKAAQAARAAAAAAAAAEADDGAVTIGMVGYPNVGKSSTINALCGMKRVAVTSQPGKTKHFQTIKLTPLVTLCDCPGLVFPTFLNSKAEMVCNGVLSIDQCTDYLSPVALICQRIPQRVLCARYAITYTSDEQAAAAAQSAEAMPADTLTETTEAQRFLYAIAKARGFTTQAHGEPDASRAARLVVKDYISGALFYAMPPPGVSPAEFVAWQGSGPTVDPIIASPSSSSSSSAAAAAQTSSAAPSTMMKGYIKANGRKTRARARARAAAMRRAAISSGMAAAGELDEDEYVGTAHTSGRSGSDNYMRTRWKHSPVPVSVLRDSMRRGQAAAEGGPEDFEDSEGEE